MHRYAARRSNKFYYPKRPLERWSNLCIADLYTASKCYRFNQQGLSDLLQTVPFYIFQISRILWPRILWSIVLKRKNIDNNITCNGFIQLLIDLKKKTYKQTNLVQNLRIQIEISCATLESSVKKTSENFHMWKWSTHNILWRQSFK